MTKVEIRISGIYKIGQLRAVGDHSEVFEGFNMHTMDRVALKMEYSRAAPSVFREYEALKHLEGCIGIPLAYQVTNEGDYRILITELLGNDLGVYFEKCQGYFSIKTCMIIADQITSILEFIHERGFVYNDIKPGNICMGGENVRFNSHIIDFSMCHPYRGQDGNFLDNPSNYENLYISQDIFFSPIASHEKKARYPKDDIESLIYMLLYFMTGTLPWVNVLLDSKLDEMSKKSHLYTLKKNFQYSEFWKNALVKPSITSSKTEVIYIPELLKQIYVEIMAMDGKQQVDYRKIRTAFKQVLVENNLQYDLIYDWILMPVRDQLIQEEELNGDQELRQSCSGVIFNFEEQERIAELVHEYDQNIDLIKQRLEKARGKNSKYDSMGRLDKRVQEQKTKNEKGRAQLKNSANKQKQGSKAMQNNMDGQDKQNSKKKKDCNLI